MAIDPAAQTVDQLETLIARYQERGLTHMPEYLAYVEEHARKATPRLKINVTISAIRKAAIQGIFVSYGDLALENGIVWSSARRLMPKHLDAILWKCYHFKWLLITAIVVNKQHLSTGAMEPDSLAGFCEGARRLGISIIDEQDFLKSEQQRTFEWARLEPTGQPV